MKGRMITYFLIGGAAAFSLFVLASSIRTADEKYSYKTEFYANNTDFPVAGKSHVLETDETHPETNPLETSAQEPTDFLWIDINRADSEELVQLSGIGKSIADKIIAYRIGAGGFSDITQLTNVDGIGEKTFAAIKDHIYVTQEYTVPYYETEAESEDSQVSSEIYSEETDPVPEATDPLETVPETEPELEPIEINAASAEDFERLPGVNAELAENIINLRTSIQYFQHINELIYAEGMTVEIFSGIKEYVYVAK